MSIKDRLAKKTQDLVYPVKGDLPMTPNALRTGPGQMLMVNSLMRESNEKVAVLEERLRQFEGGLPVRLLDAAQVRPSKWANRIADNFDGERFTAFKAEISAASGNVQPIKVRPLGDEEDPSAQFEIIFGHRRHRACLELNLPVLAVVEEMSDADLFKQMDRENRSRADLSPWEQGMMYRQALDDKLFGSREQLARELGIDAGNLSKALRLAHLDPNVLAAFDSPLHLQYRWAKPLSDALLEDPARVERVLQTLVAHRSTKHSPKEIFDALVGSTAAKPNSEPVRVGKRIVAEIYHENERITVRFASGALDEAGVERLRAFLGLTLFS
ncbi:MAG: hypothetical protein NVSMB6_22000 [Burkholderiaceae bacterium]